MSGEELGRLARAVRDRLRAAGVETPDLDARLLVEWITGATRLDLIAAPDRIVAAEDAERLRAAVERRAGGEPTHRIIGAREFYGLSFRLSPDTLEPRPDTEALVELALPFLEQLTADGARADLLDMGTGTGAIAVALLHRCSAACGVGVDIAEGALAMARLNAAAAGVPGRFAALRSDWFAAVSGRFHLIVSNPPYIPHRDIAGLSREVREHDPLRALDGGADGLDFYRALAQGAGEHLYDGGRVAVEIGVGQHEDVRRIFEAAGFILHGAADDLGGHRRALIFALGTA